jgi:hypothetical protein
MDKKRTSKQRSGNNVLSFGDRFAWRQNTEFLQQGEKEVGEVKAEEAVDPKDIDPRYPKLGIVQKPEGLGAGVDLDFGR